MLAFKEGALNTTGPLKFVFTDMPVVAGTGVAGVWRVHVLDVRSLGTKIIYDTSDAVCCLQLLSEYI